MSRISDKETATTVTENVLGSLYESIDESVEYVFMESIFEFMNNNNPDALTDLCIDYMSRDF